MYPSGIHIEQRTFGYDSHGRLRSVRLLLAVRHYTVENSLLTYSGNYPAGELEAIKSVDPDGHTTIVFSDWRGRTILTRRMLSEGEYADTYTVYDHWGNPVAVVPPLGTKHLATKGEKYKLTDPMIAHVQNYLYIYSYDDALRLISAKAPGVEAVTTTYDPNGLVAFTDDGNLRKSGRTRFMLYDSAARPVVTGICDTPSGTSAVPSMHASISGTGIDKTGYSATYAQLQNPTVLTATYYDSNTPPDISKIQSYTSKYSSKAGLIRGTLERVMDSGQFITTLYNYDSEERIIGRASTTHTDKVMLIVNTSYNIDGSVAGSETILVHPTGPHFDRRTFGYDKHGRLTSVKQSLDDRPEVTLWTGTYNAIGQLATASTGLFTENLAYEIDGSLKSRISGVFSQQISRDGLYNGSISRITDTLDGKQSTASYTYDNLDRLTAADIKIGGRDRSTSYSYDLNGNITSLTRIGDDGDDTERIIDDLSLKYNGNQLSRVSEYAEPVYSEATMNFVKNGVLLTPYKYDPNGNLLIDPSKGASYIWDANNRLQGIDYEEKKASINITRSASGAKLAEISEKFVMGAGFSRITNARHYYGPFEYLDNSLARVNVSGGYIDASGKFHAYVTDWQGNVRAVVSKEFTGPVIEQTTWYYPYGMPTCDGRHPSVNRYKYTGKELITDNATNLYDYPARLYDPALCRWITVDPLTHENAPVSHYSMCASGPINHIDPDGRDYYLFDREGYLQTYTPIESFDLIAVIDENGAVNFSNIFEGGTLTPVSEITDIDEETGNEVQINTYNVTGDYNAKDIHEFLSDNTNVEFSRLATGEIGGSQALNILSTSHITNEENGFYYAANAIHKNGGNVRLMIHNHPSNSISSRADLDSKLYLQENSPAFACTKFLIYCKPTSAKLKYYYDYTTRENDD